MSWNYRIVSQPDPSVEGGLYFAIHEAYYDDEGRVWGVTKEPAAVDGESVEGLIETRIRMLEAQKRPVLAMADVPEPGAVNPAAKQRRLRRKVKT